MLVLLVLFLTSSVDAQATNQKSVPAKYVQVQNKSSLCDIPNPSTADPDKCCSFPDLFNDSLVDQCEKEFGLNISVVGNELMADSCVIECVFNRSGLNNKSKLVREDVVKVFKNRTKNDLLWNLLITKAVDTCFNELSLEAIEDYADSVSKEATLNKKFPVNKMCHPLAAFTLDCIYIELFKVCPQEKFNQTISGCTSLKNYAIECDEW